MGFNSGLVRGGGPAEGMGVVYNAYARYTPLLLLSPPLSVLCSDTAVARKGLAVFNRYAHSAGPDCYTGLSAKLIE